MAARAFRTLPAITPDTRHHDHPAVATATASARSVSFGLGSLQTPAPTSSSDPTAGKEEEEAQLALLREQYSQYRAAPDQFPSYDRMRFVRLPQDWLPEGLRDSNSDDQGRSRLLLQHWPALVYQNLAELVRDLSPAESKILKGKLILEHRKQPATVVARLLGWKEIATARPNNRLRTRNTFEETKLELIRLSGSSLQENENSENNELINFVDGQLELESICEELMDTSNNISSTVGGVEVLRHARQFQRAVDMALNCLAMDVGADPLPMRDDDDDMHQTPKMDGGVPSNGGGDARTSTAGDKSVFSVEMGERANAKRSDSKVTKNDKLKKDGGGAIIVSRSKKSSKRKIKGAAKKAAAASNNDKENQDNFSNASSKKRKESKSKTKAFQLQCSSGLQHRVAVVSKTTKVKPSTVKQAKKKAPAPTKPIVIAAKSKRSKKQIFKKAGSTTTNLTFPANNSDHELTSSNENVSWKDLWAAMTRSGWSWKGGTGLMTDFYYIKPRCKVKNGTAGEDYFICEKDVREYARSTYKWGTTGVSRERVMAAIVEYASYSQEVVPPMTTNIQPNEPWSNLWRKMMQSGWAWRAGSGLMLDYYYIKPGCKSSKKHGAVEGQDYFCRKEDVQKFAMRNYGWLGEEECVADAGEDACVQQQKRQKVERATQPTKKDITVKATAVKNKKTELKEKSTDDCVLVDKEESNDGISDTGSTYSQSGFQSKKLFLEECADNNIPPLNSNIGPNGAWRDVWETMRHSGWTWKIGSGLMTDYYYIKPGCKVGKGSDAVEGQDYFVCEEDVQRFAMRNYGWRKTTASGEESCIGKKKRSTDSVDKKAIERQQEKRQKVNDKAKRISQLQQTLHKSFKVKLSASRGTTALPPPLPQPSNSYDKKSQWKALQEEGWRAIRAGKYNNLHDWYYLPRECDPGDGKSQLGVDYFLCEEDAIKSATQSFKVKSSLSKGTKSLQPSNSYDKKAQWKALQEEGWRAIRAGKYNNLHDWYYLPRDCDPGDGKSQLGVDYFLCEEDAIESVKDSPAGKMIAAPPTKSKCKPDMSTAKKMPSKSKSSKGANDEDDDLLSTPDDCKTRPQDPGIPLLSSAESCTSPTASSHEFYSWNNLWPVLQRAGWTSMKAGRYNPLHDWYYVRPNRDPADELTTLGTHYFICQKDVSDYVRCQDKKEGAHIKGGRRGKRDRKSIGVMLGAFEEEANKARDDGL